MATNSINTYEVPTTNRERTMPLQPAFFAYNSTARTNVTGDGTAYTMIFNTEVLDQNSDYNNTTGVFTAPVTGFYMFFSSVSMSDVTKSNGSLVFDLNAGTPTHGEIKKNFSLMATADDDLIVNIKAGMYLTAADTIKLVLTISGGIKDQDVDNSILTSFSGALVF